MVGTQHSTTQGSQHPITSQPATWALALAARIAFSLTPNSAGCERVFSLVQCMFGSLQTASLADQIRAALMLRYNDRVMCA
eukprot:scaffold33450_cov37-Tisochrysis_lutea.AAC.1